ncbi:hypothetical protein FG87_31880 [Nocardia vulneris]|uniref:Uncharacterized protein n=1 Tax=Nocardia vulneris TaxID=1141657 RepID=A0ABR4Z7C2_9NOCA|nr:hypothetical protein FG87_31880 [Nocardia vulneris]
MTIVLYSSVVSAQCRKNQSSHFRISKRDRISPAQRANLCEDRLISESMDLLQSFAIRCPPTGNDKHCWLTSVLDKPMCNLESN